MIVAFCNPLIDAVIPVEESFLEKWGLKNDDAILANESFQPLINQVVSNPDAFMTPGGAGQNTLSMAQWMMQEKGTTIMVGSVGPDSNKNLLEGMMNKNGVRCLYQQLEGKNTGCCAILCCNNNRSIVASVAASGCFSFEKWDNQETLNAVKNAKAVFMSTFFLRSSDKTGLAVAAECVARNIPLAINLSSPNAIDSEAWPTLKQIIRVSSLVFGNEVEFIALGKKIGVVKESQTQSSINMKELAKSIANYQTCGIKRTVVLTMGSEPTIACQAECEPITSEIIPIEPSQIIDTNGAGDAYAGGFLSQYIFGKPLAHCLKAGAYAAWCILKQRGALIPSYKPTFQ